MTPSKKSDCYYITLHQFQTRFDEEGLTRSILIDSDVDPKDLDFEHDFWVVHGNVKMGGKDATHAWIEIGPLSIEAQNGRRDVYYKDYYNHENKVIDFVRYSPIDTMNKLMSGFGFCPWFHPMAVSEAAKSRKFTVEEIMKRDFLNEYQTHQDTKTLGLL
jgi:hypothetical protein